MASIDLKARIRVDPDLYRLVAFRQALRDIANGPVFDPAAELARDVLREWGEDDPDIRWSQGR
jgi:hypothetical protein